ncbi:hypothetical protein MJC1_02914 [Methylocystis sp. MJC1]|nr:hypothetical protein MJC1_02914 [Methylocystis sp. MJC1]
MKQVGAEAISPSTRMLANGLGWFSLGLGLLEAIAPKRLAAPFGLEKAFVSAPDLWAA